MASIKLNARENLDPIKQLKIRKGLLRQIAPINLRTRSVDLSSCHTTYQRSNTVSKIHYRDDYCQFISEKAKAPAPVQYGNISEIIHMRGDELQTTLEAVRLSEIKFAADEMVANISMQGRCPICTLIPPCNHYLTSSEFLGGLGGRFSPAMSVGSP